ncbi:hypothetical protein JS73_08080 [Synergistes jonesii]|uniref:Uncharacterized protein n=1 Tax=Synergistes jonesii TaxID=2754 RepID=A0A073IQ94_9BACT|nr:hypothetical protein EH55_05970 [Synergistes jonesii]OFB61883.1 hypothetical protein JS72_09255 [Synergistes jonesii]OFB62212.1 hypothetical protein JS73_08080 [Synergistes jonesii]OFB62940.1 hypothetical protein JS79_08545 [Synergistes jonesii]OFB67446.1 hypothetical protein JS78_08085 [Synergistes jonesii]
MPIILTGRGTLAATAGALEARARKLTPYAQAPARGPAEIRKKPRRRKTFEKADRMLRTYPLRSLIKDKYPVLPI